MLRRDVITGLAGAGLVSGLGVAGAAQAQDFADIGSLTPNVMNSRAAFSAMGPFKNIAILGYNLGLVVQSEIKAFGGAGSAQSSTAASLTGLSIDEVQTIADHALVDFADVLRQTGRPLLLMDAIRQAPSFATLKASPVPFRKQPAADARRVMMVPPHGMNLILTNADSPITDKSPFDLKNAMALSHLSFELDAVVLIPNVIIDFAQLSSSGNSVYSGSASTGIDPGMYLVELWTGLGAYHGRNKFGGDGGRAQLQKRIRLGQGGQLVQTREHSNRDEVAWWNSRVNSGMAEPYEVGPGFAYSSSSYEYQANVGQFQRAALSGAKAMNRVYAQAVAALK